MSAGGGRHLVEMIRRANAPPPPEHSVALRVATALAVFVGVAACERVGEVPPLPALLAVLGIGAGMVYSYVTRARPWQPLKLLLALAVLAVFVDFVVSVTGAARVGNLASVEAPLAGLFVWVQVIHSVDVPARRDLLFSLAASGVLLAVAGAQAIDSGFAVYVVLWAVAVVTGLTLSWRSILGGGGAPPIGTVAVSAAVIALGAGLVVAALPAPAAQQGLTLPASLSSFVALSNAGGLAGGPNGAEPAQPGKPGGSTGVGGYVGFAGPLDTALRGSLGDQVVFHVRATIPGYFLGATYDRWDGQSWTSSPPFRGTTPVDGGSPFEIPWQTGANPGPTDVQTFYVAVPMPNLIFSTERPQQVWFPDRRLYVGKDQSIRSAVAITPGTVYTVISSDDQLSPSQLARLRPARSLPAALAPYLQLPAPSPYARVHQLALSVTAGKHSLLGKVEALEAWMAGHVRYSTDIPPLLPGQDAVNQFLFGTRVGYCEQISTALAVMLRTLGIPTREAIGYVPGSYNPLTNLYEVQAKDAHAWVQVWFPGAGWQSFDPTADVPLAPPDAGAVLASDAWHLVRGLPWLFLLPAGAVIGSEEVLRRRWRRRPRSWTERAARVLEAAGARAGVRRRQDETLAEYAARVRGTSGAGGADAGAVDAAVRLLERTAYGPDVADAADQAALMRTVREGAAVLRRRSWTGRLRSRRRRAEVPAGPAPPRGR